MYRACLDDTFQFHRFHNSHLSLNPTTVVSLESDERNGANLHCRRGPRWLMGSQSILEVSQYSRYFRVQTARAAARCGQRRVIGVWGSQQLFLVCLFVAVFNQSGRGVNAPNRKSCVPSASRAGILMATVESSFVERVVGIPEVSLAWGAIRSFLFVNLALVAVTNSLTVGGHLAVSSLHYTLFPIHEGSSYVRGGEILQLPVRVHSLRTLRVLTPSTVTSPVVPVDHQTVSVHNALP